MGWMYIWKTQPANLENSSVATGLEKVSFHSNPKEYSNYHTIVLNSHTNKAKLKILQARFQQHVNRELPDVQDGFRKKAEEPEIKLPTFTGSLKKQGSSRKTSTSASVNTLKALTVWSPQTVENSQRDGNIRPPDLPLEKPICRSGSNS